MSPCRSLSRLRMWTNSTPFFLLTVSRCLPSTPRDLVENRVVGLQASTLCPALASQQRVPYALNQIVRFRDLKPGCARYAEVRVKPTLVSTVD